MGCLYLHSRHDIKFSCFIVPMSIDNMNLAVPANRGYHSECVDNLARVLFFVPASGWKYSPKVLYHSNTVIVIHRVTEFIHRALLKSI